jgi:hypothetical protein
VFADTANRDHTVFAGESPEGEDTMPDRKHERRCALWRAYGRLLGGVRAGVETASATTGMRGARPGGAEPPLGALTVAEVREVKASEGRPKRVREARATLERRQNAWILHRK